MTIGQRIQKRRKELGLSATQLADKLQVDRTTIYRYESGYIENMPTSIVEPLAKELQTTPSYLMGWTDNADTNIPQDDNIENLSVKLDRELAILLLQLSARDIEEVKKFIDYLKNRKKDN